jgi:hypothetical protein
MGDRLHSISKGHLLLKRSMKLILAVVVAALCIGVGAAGYAMFLYDGETASEYVQGYALLPGADMENSVVESRSVQSIVKEGRYFDLGEPEGQQSVSLDSCWGIYTKQEGDFTVSEERKTFRMHRAVSTSASEFIRDQEFDIACDYSAVDVATISVGGLNVFDSLWDEPEVGRNPMWYSLSGFELSENDHFIALTRGLTPISGCQVEIHGRDILEMEVLGADISLGYKVDGGEENGSTGEVEIFELPARFLVNKGIFESEGVEDWKQRDYIYKFKCLEDSCTFVEPS